MTRRERKKQNKLVGKLLKFIPIIFILVIIVFFYMIFDMKNKVEDSYYNVENSNTSKIENVENIDNTSVNNFISNDIIENNVDNTQINNNTANKTQETSNVAPITSTDKASNTTDKKQTAIDIVKESWGEDNDVLFDCYVNSNGEYIVSITDIQSGKVLTYYQVNLETRKINIY